MRLVSISLRNLRIRMVASILTMLSIVAATALYAAILVMAEQTAARYEGSIGGLDQDEQSSTVTAPKKKQKKN